MKAADIMGEVGGVRMEMMVDSRSSVSTVRKEMLDHLQGITTIQPALQVQLITASGEPLPILELIKAPTTQLSVSHEFVVVNNLVTPAILGIDFLQRHMLVLDFTTTPVSIMPSERKHSPRPVEHANEPEAFLVVLESERQAKIKMCAVAAVEDATARDTIDECAIPQFGGPPRFEFPECPR